MFHHWADAFASDIEVRALQLPGRQERLHEGVLTSSMAAVEGIAAALQVLPPAPLVLYGHSYGAILAFELARRLRATPYCPQALVLAARRAPQLARRGRSIAKLPDEEFKEMLYQEYGTPRSVIDNHQLMELALPALRADFHAVESYTYVPDAPLEIPLLALHGTQDTLVRKEEMAAWRDVCSGSFQLEEVKAGHFFIDTHREWVLAKVDSVLRSVR